MTSKLSKRIYETELALSYYTDVRALLAHGASYPSRSWKNTVHTYVPGQLVGMHVHILLFFTEKLLVT